AGPEEGLTRFAERYLAELPSAGQDGPAASIHERLADRYAELMANSLAERTLVLGVIAYTSLAIAGVAFVAVSSPAGATSDSSTVAAVAHVGSTIVGAALIGRGVVSLPSSRVDAYRWFMRGLL